MASTALPIPGGDLVAAIRDTVLQGFAPRFGELGEAFGSNPGWRAVTAAGSEVWLDTGDIDAAAELWSSEIKGLTTNNTLLNREVQKGIYDEFVGEVAAVVREQEPDADEDTLVREIAFALNARHGLALVARFDAHVSVELHTDLAHDLAATCHYARRFWAICPERFFVKIPLTPAGLLAARRLGKEGVLINFTLGFSARQNDLTVRVADPTFCNVFLGRLNSFVADSELGSGAHTGQRALKASADNVRGLRESGVADTRQIAASIRNGQQVWDLAGCDVLTVPVGAAQEALGGEASANAGGLLAAGFEPDVDDANLDLMSTLWAVDDRHQAFMSALLAEDLDGMTADQLVAFAADHGGADLVVDWSAEDVARVDDDGKIPNHAFWKDRVASGDVGLDAAFNLSGLRSFAADQKAMDDRIRSLLTT